MSFEPLDPEKVKAIKQAKEDNPTWGSKRICRYLKNKGIEVGETAVKKYSDKHIGAKDVDPDEFSMDESKDSLEISAKTECSTVDAFLEEHKVDLETWELSRYILNRWGDEVGKRQKFQIKIWLVRKTPQVDVGKAFLDLKKELKEYKPLKLKQYNYKGVGGLFEIDIFDPHIGKLCWLPETDNNYDINIAEEIFMDIIGYFLARAQIYKTEKILFPIGNDLFHVDTKTNLTTGGTPQDVDGRHQRVFKRGCEILIKAIEQLRTIAPVDVVVIAGNHDELSTMHAGEVLGAWFRNDKNVNIDTKPILRKYYQYHKSLIGLTHGDKEKKADLPLIMAQEAKKAWAETEFRYFRIAHTHHRQKSQTQTTLDHKGVQITTGKSISPADAWHFGKGFIGSIRGAEAYFYTKESGQIDEFSYNISTEKELFSNYLK